MKRVIERVAFSPPPARFVLTVDLTRALTLVAGIGLVFGMLLGGRLAHAGPIDIPRRTLSLLDLMNPHRMQEFAGTNSAAQSMMDADSFGPAAPDQETATPTPPGTAPPPTLTPTPAACPTLECPGCPGPRPALEWLEEADSVFRGRVSQVVPEECDHRVWFEVREVWKGPSPFPPEQSAWVGLMSWQCMRSYAVDDDVIVFAVADTDGNLHLPMCFGITDGDVEGELGPGTPVGGTGTATGTAGTETPGSTTETPPPTTETPDPTAGTPDPIGRVWLPWGELDGGLGTE